MKRKEIADLKNKNASELGKYIYETQKELGKVKLERMVGKQQNVHAAKALRRKIAIAKTLVTLDTLAAREK